MVKILPLQLVAFALLAACSTEAAERSSIDSGWRFRLGDADGAEATSFDDSEWRQLDLPHDWSVEHPIVSDAPSSGGGGYHRTGVGWYRRTLKVEGSKLRPHPPFARLFLDFEGVYRNATVWLNGVELDTQAYGYTPFSIEVTDHVRYDEPNVLAVRVDNSAQPNSRWFSGSGIYRHVWLRVSHEISVEPTSFWAETREAESGGATVTARFEVTNTTDETIDLEAEVTLIDQDGRPAASGVTFLQSKPGESVPGSAELAVADPRWWSPASPDLYQLKLELRAVSPTNAMAIETISQPCGLRTIEVDAERGFLLNGRPVVMFGGCVHHDHGLLGAASFDAAERRKARLLKEAGYNAVRTSHNPPAKAFLDACDELGLLVLDEAFDGWRKNKVDQDYGEDFDANWRDDLAAMVRRDRRHPSVVMWSIGNEVYERGEESGVRLAEQMSQLVKSLDTSRPVTAGICGLWGAGDWPKLDPLFAHLDVCGYNYEIARYATDHERLPDRVVYGSETYPVDIFKGWQATTSQPWAIGDFVWTAMDYLGESAIGRVYPPGETPQKHWEAEHFPWRGAACGDIDLLGYRKPISYHRQIVWEQGEKLYAWVVPPTGVPGDNGLWQLTPWASEPGRADWNWDVADGTPLTVRVVSRWPTVRLLLNGEAVGEAPTGIDQEFEAEFSVPYESGELIAQGLDDRGEVREERHLVSAGDAAKVALLPESESADAGRQTIVYVDVRLTDAQGRPQPLADREVEFAVEGPAEIATAGNADLTETHAYNTNRCGTHEGRAQVVLRSTGKPGRVELTATAEGLPPATAVVEFAN